ncbi:MBL fold metallo-hydrolase [Oceanirhabdus seepicola]|uniref:MBL fold metallo-hydrolase n=1 Tax=Oceanirhabdus seepicola TaxID=2828781 RepID=A0A9J6P1T8_9CLOT|nr:MBL fold metallo-hydrolase [Oceanirhabdus seepicola]MCM1989464.1 MBL fold metallo-hydrolase [Oceanirhabdus seepicola]
MCTDWFKTNQITNNIYSIDDNGDNIMYLIIGNEKALLIDTGWGVGNLKEVVSKITDLPLIVVNTHGHPDHVSGGYQFSDIYIGEDDIPILKGCFKLENRQWALNNVLKGPYTEEFSSEQWLHSKLGNIFAIKNGHKFDLGNKIIEVIELPGHTPGGIGLLDREERILFSGDSILKGHIWMHLDHSTSLSTYLSGLKKLELDINAFDTILPAHGTSFKSQMLNKLISDIEDILYGKKQGTTHQTFCGEGLLCEFEDYSILYDGSKL